MSAVDDLIPGVQAFRPFLPARAYETSLRFYEAIGFHANPLGEAMAELSLGPHAFLLHHVEDPADPPVMHVLVDDVQAWWRHFDSLKLADRFGVPAVAPPRVEPWGLTVTYVADPSEILWHFAEPTRA